VSLEFDFFEYSASLLLEYGRLNRSRNFFRESIYCKGPGRFFFLQGKIPIGGPGSIFVLN